MRGEQWRRRGVAAVAVSFIGADAFVTAFDRIFSSFGDWLGETAGNLIETLIKLLFYTPELQAYQPVREVNQLCSVVAVVSAPIVLKLAGISFMDWDTFGMSSIEARRTVQRVVVAVAFIAMSLPLLQLGVDMSNALVEVFRPKDVSSFEELIGVGTTVTLAGILNTALLAMLVILLALRLLYLWVIAAASPVIVMLWAHPKTQDLAAPFISGWLTVLALTPVEALILRFNLAMFQTANLAELAGVSQWLFGVGGGVLMLWIPIQLHGASRDAVYRAYSAADSIWRTVDSATDRGSRRSSRNREDKRRNRR